MTTQPYWFERHGGTEVTVFDVGGVRARTGARGTRFFRAEVEAGADPLRLAQDALARMAEVRRRWPWPEWPRPAGLTEGEQEIVLPALMLAAGRSVEEVDRVVRAGREPRR